MRRTATAKPPTFSGQDASQDAAELAQFVALLQSEKVSTYGEIGALRGDTFHRVLTSLPRGAKGVLLDIGEKDNVPYIKRAIADLNARGYEASCVWGDSKAAAVRQSFAGRGPFDAVFIDADHRIDAVTADWMYAKDIARIVGFHDICGPMPKRGRDPRRIQVKALWHALKEQGYRTVEFATPGSYQGIGVIWPQSSP